MSNNYIIRLAEVSDLPQLMKVVAEVVISMNAAGNFQWDQYYPNEKVFEQDISLQQLWVADTDGQIAGVAAITTDQDSEYADVGWDITETAIVTHRLAVGINHQGKGIAKALMQQAEQIALKRNIRILRVDTNSNNTATQALFPKLGYVYAGEISLAFRPGLRFYCYEKKLN